MSRTHLTLATALAAALLLAVGAAGASSFPFGSPGAPAPDAATAATSSSADAGPEESGALKVGGDVKEPVLLNRVQPAYPEEARKNRIQGSVILSTIVDDKGNVEKVEPVESPDPLLTDAAIEAVRKWTYRPATKNGKPVKVRMTVTVAFKLA